MNRGICTKIPTRDVLTVSCDDMNKLNVGGSMMVSRYHQINKIYMCDDEPNYEDHDFNCSGYKIIPSGHMQLCFDEKLSLAEQTSSDNVYHELDFLIYLRITMINVTKKR